MNQAQLQGNWQQLKGKVREQWGKLTQDDLSETQGNAEKIIGKIAERYGIEKEKAQIKFNQFLEKVDEKTEGKAKEAAMNLFGWLGMAGDKLSSFAKTCEKFSKNKPMATLGIAAVVGALVGMCFSHGGHGENN